MARRARRNRENGEYAGEGRRPAARATIATVTIPIARGTIERTRPAVFSPLRSVEPRSKVSMNIRRPPQHVHGSECIGGSSASLGSISLA